jgi:hypothetical protein
MCYLTPIYVDQGCTLDPYRRRDTADTPRLPCKHHKINTEMDVHRGFTLILTVLTILIPLPSAALIVHHDPTKKDTSLTCTYQSLAKHATAATKYSNIYRFIALCLFLEGHDDGN